MGRKKKAVTATEVAEELKVEEANVATEGAVNVTDVETKPQIGFLDLNLGRADLNELVGKVNELIKKVNE